MIQHLALAYAYGDGREQSCELMTEAVSDLMFGLQIDSYFATNISTVHILNDEIGGVEVLIEDEALAEKYPEFAMGETVLLKGEQAEHYIRYPRYKSASDSADTIGASEGIHKSLS